MPLPDAFELIFLHAFVTSRYASAILVNFALVLSTVLLLLCYGRRIGYPALGAAAAILTHLATLAGMHDSFADAQVRTSILLFPIFYLLQVWAGPRVTRFGLVSIAPLASAMARRLLAYHRSVRSRFITPIVFVVSGVCAVWARCVTYMNGTAHWLWPLRVQFGAAATLAYFCYFAIPGLDARFTSDDLMNLDYYWAHGAKALGLGLLDFPSTFYRPMGGLFYFVVYRFAGLHPAPYHWIAFLILIANIYLAFRFGTLLSGSRAIGGFTALLVAYQAGIGDITCNTGVIYDILCFTFYFAAFVYYLNCRVNHCLVSKWRLAIFLALYIGALDSKEMAVSLPAMVLVYELLFHPPQGFSWVRIYPWIAREGQAAVCGGLLTLIFIVGKLTGPEPLTAMDAYRPVITVHNFLDSMSRLFNNLLFIDFFNVRNVAVTLILALFAILLTRARILSYCYFHVLIAILPIAFLPARGSSCYYVILPGIALAAAVTLWRLVRSMERLPATRTVVIAAQTAIVAVAAISCLRFNELNKHYVRQWIGPDETLIWSVLGEVRRERPVVRRGGSIAFLTDPFEEWQMSFIARLWFDDHGLRVLLNRKTPLSPVERAATDVLYTFEGSTLKRVK